MDSAESSMDRRRVRVIVDSSSNVPQDLQAELGMLEVPAIVNFGEDSYRNGIDLGVDEFYERLAASPKPPTTSQPPPPLFEEAYQQAFRDGAEHLIVVTVSSRLSGTYGSAQLASRAFDPKQITVWDSWSASIGSGWQALEAARLAVADAPMSEILLRLETVRQRMLGYFTVESLRYLANSGRVGSLQAGVGDLLSVKPILEMRHHVLEQVARVRGRRRSLREIVARTGERVGANLANFAVGHANSPDEAAALAERLSQEFNAQEILIVEVGPTLASLGGPGCIGVASYVA